MSMPCFLKYKSLLKLKTLLINYLLISTSLDSSPSRRNDSTTGMFLACTLLSQFWYTISMRNSQVKGPVYAKKPALNKQLPTRHSLAWWSCLISNSHLIQHQQRSAKIIFNQMILINITLILSVKRLKLYSLTTVFKI